MAGLTLLLAFQQVVAGAVEQGRLQRLATTSQVERVWRCKLLGNDGARTDCLARVDAAHDLVSPPGSDRARR